MVAFILAVAAALVFSFLCSIFESVLLSLGHAQVESLVQQGRRSGHLMAGFKRDIDVPIAAILIVNTIAHTVGAAVAGATYGNVFDPQTLWVFTIVFTIAVLLLTEIVPKTLGVSFAERLATPVAYGILGFTRALQPLVWLSSRISRALRGGREAPITSVEEIRLLAALGRSEGSVGRGTAAMIMGATHLRQLRAEEVMVPRNRVTYLGANMSRDELLQVLKHTRFSRFPFTRSGDPDQMVGLVLAKELLLQLNLHPEQAIDWESLVREPLVVPETKPVNVLLREFQQERTHMALVVDEYGTFSGIVTNEDLLEEIVGEMFDESDDPVEELTRLEDGTLQVPATIDLRKVCRLLDLPWRATERAVTLGGLITELLGRLPRTGDTVHWRKYRLEVLAANDLHAERVSIQREQTR